MNRMKFYSFCLSGAVGMGLLVGTPVCRPVFGSLLNANQDQEKRQEELLVLMSGGSLEDLHHGDGHHGDSHGSHGKIKGHH